MTSEYGTYESVICGDGKYVVRIYANGRMQVYRNGDLWKTHNDRHGDEVLFCFVTALIKAREYKESQANGWIANAGNTVNCPAGLEYILVVVELRDETQLTGIGRSYYWDHIGNGGDIIKYKVIK